MHLSPHSQVLRELLAGQSSMAMPTGSGEILPSPCCLNRSDETLLGLISSPLAVVTRLEPALLSALSAKCSHFLAWQEGGFAAALLFKCFLLCWGIHPSGPTVCLSDSSNTTSHAMEQHSRREKVWLFPCIGWVGSVWIWLH